MTNIRKVLLIKKIVIDLLSIKLKIMKTALLKSLHNRSILELELIEKCKMRADYFERMMKAKEDNNMNYWAYSFAELLVDIKRSKRIEKRVYTWYLQTLNKIMKYSN